MADFEDLKVLLKGNQIINLKSTFDFIINYKNLKLGNPFKFNKQTY